MNLSASSGKKMPLTLIMTQPNSLWDHTPNLVLYQVGENGLLMPFQLFRFEPQPGFWPGLV
jgi:hypothetical protein